MDDFNAIAREVLATVVIWLAAIVTLLVSIALLTRYA